MGLVALRDEERDLPVVRVSCREPRGKPRAHPEFGSCTNSSSGLALVAAYWKQRGAKGLWWAEPRSSAGQQAGLLPTSKPWLSCDLLPSKLGSCLRQSHCYLPWINNLNYWSPVGQIFPVLAALQPFNLLSSLITSEPGGIGRRERSSALRWVFPWKGCRCATATTAGRGLEPTKEVHLEGASAALRFRGQMWQHLEVCHELHLQNITAPIRWGAGGKGLLGSWGATSSKFLNVPWATGWRWGRSLDF